MAPHQSVLTCVFADKTELIKVGPGRTGKKLLYLWIACAESCFEVHFGGGSPEETAGYVPRMYFVLGLFGIHVRVCGRAAVLRLSGAWARQAFVGPVSPPRARSPSEGEVFTDGFLWQHTSCDGALAACGECSISHGECSGNGYWRKGGQSALELKAHKGQGSIDSTVCQ